MQERTDGVYDRGDLGPEESVDNGDVGENIPRVDQDTRLVIPDQGSPKRYREPLFSRGGSSGSWLIDIGSNIVTLLVLVVLGLLAVGAWYAGGFVWGFTRPALDEWGFPFATHVCNGDATDLENDPVLRAMGVFVTAGVVEADLRTAFRSGRQIQVDGRTGMRFPMSRSVGLIVHDPAGLAGIGLMAVHFDDRQPLCHVISALGLPEGKYHAARSGQVQGPFGDKLELYVDPRRGKASEIRLRAVVP